VKSRCRIRQKIATGTIRAPQGASGSVARWSKRTRGAYGGNSGVRPLFYDHRSVRLSYNHFAPIKVASLGASGGAMARSRRPTAALYCAAPSMRTRFQPFSTSSVETLKLTSVLGPNVVAMATSIASRPLAISIRPIRGTLLRGSKVYQRPPRYASNQAAKSIGPAGGTPISPR
jgi:hypothetical protein